jgi:predicted nucleic acid-binding protein
MIRVVDASAIGALIFGEKEKSWVETQTASAELIAPPLLDFELGNICWKKLRRFPEDAELLLAAWDSWCASTLVANMPSDPIQSIRLARTHGLTFYDASYLWLAQYRNADLISLDARLVRVARSMGLHAPMPNDTGHTTPRSRS